jgi:hypothetical protein
MDTPDAPNKRFAIFSQSSLEKTPKLIFQTLVAPVRKPQYQKNILPVTKTAVDPHLNVDERHKPHTPASPLATPALERSAISKTSQSPPSRYRKKLKAVKYTLEPGSGHMIGSRAYYRTWAFRKRKYDRRNKEAEELGLLLDVNTSKKKSTIQPVHGGGRRKVDERWKRYLRRQ